MNNNFKNIIKTGGIIICIILLAVLGYLIITLNKASHEEKNTPVIITPVPEKVMPQPSKTQPRPVINKPMTRDVNDMPKSDYKVPEFG